MADTPRPIRAYSRYRRGRASRDRDDGSAGGLADRHQRIFNTLLALMVPLHLGSPLVDQIVVVDIDAQSLATCGKWPWPRSRIAELVEAIGQAGAAAVAIDMLFEGPDAKSPATLARQLGGEIGRSDIIAWADTLPDGDRRLAEALAPVPVALGFVIDHGGMVDKLVGDGVHALFNTPLDVADHPLKAVRCAMAIRAWTEAYRHTARAAALGLGRTRIGIETGDVIVGDVGIRAKLDYTAYGDAVNSAARLEAANKELGSTICIGPEAASRCPPHLLRPIGRIQLRGFSEAVCTYEPILIA